MGGQLLLAMLILVFLFLLPSASPRTGALGGEVAGEESVLQFTIEEGEELGGGNGQSCDGSGLYVGSDVVRGSFQSILYYDRVWIKEKREK